MGNQIGAWVQVHNALFDAAEALLATDRPDAALLFQNEMVSGARRRDDAVGAAEALLRRARTQVRLGSARAVAADLAEARLWLERLPNGDQRPVLAANLASILGESLLRTDPKRAEQVIGEAIAAFRRSRQAFRLPRLYRELSHALEELGDIGGAEASLAQGIEECEAERRTISIESLTQSYFDQVQSLFEDMLRLQAEHRADAASAFDYAERSRVGTLLDALAVARARDSSARRDMPLLSATDIQQRLQPGNALVEYALLSDRTLAWVVTPSSLRLVPISLRRDELVSELAAFRGHIDRGIWDASAQRSSEHLYDVLIRPLEPFLRDVRSVIVVPDRELHELPFALLRRAATGRFLIEDLPVSYAPSANIWARALERQPARTAKGVLVLGDPAFDSKLVPQLGRLRGARAEITKIGSLYPVSKLLTGDAATPEAFLEQAPRFPVIHLASHTLGTAFVLAPGGQGKSNGGLLEPSDIYSLRLDHTRMVVLAGCDTASGPFSAREGVASLARPFLAAGVPLVLASLWKVDDEVSAELLYRFHHGVSRGENPVVALREAQLMAFHSGRPKLASPSRWGTFEILGASFQAPP